MKKILLFIVLSFGLFIPNVVKADTWLDQESYRDISWFNEDTYSTTTIYNINTASKLAGLLYLVNEKHYTFSGKTIRVYAGNYYPSDTCGRNYSCILDMKAHDWVSLDARFDGVFNTVNSQDDISKGYHRVEFRYTDEVVPFTSDGTCKRMFYGANNGDPLIEQLDQECSMAIYKKFYKINSNVLSGRGEIDVVEIAEPGSDVFVYFASKPGFIPDVMEIKDSNNNDITMTNQGAYGRRFTMPASNVIVNGSFKLFEDYSIPEDNTPIDNKKICKVINGNGKDLGSEIACGTEHFYILSSNNNRIKMISKYNLLTGITIYKEKIERDESDTISEEQYCSNLAASKRADMVRDSFYNAPGYCFYRLPSSNGKISQDPSAISAHWDKAGNYIYPQVGDVYPSVKVSGNNNIVDSDFALYQTNNEKYDNYFFDLVVNLKRSPNELARSLIEYKEQLRNDSYEIKAIDLLTLAEINDIVKKERKVIPYREWLEKVDNLEVNPVTHHVEFGQLPSLLDKKYAWIYGTTYWIRTGYGSGGTIDSSGIMFVDTSGGVCGAGLFYSTTSGCEALARTAIGCGVRPVVTIANELEYLIKKETKGKGKIEVVSNAAGNDSITFMAIPEDGYKLFNIVITTDSGEKVLFNEDKIEKDSNGNLIVSKNKFTMPFENVTIQARFIPDIIKNPDTRNTLITILILLIINIGIGSYIWNKKEFRIND